MRTPALLLSVLCAAAGLRAAEPLMPTPTGSSIQRYLASLRLGDTLRQIESIYPPTRKWSRYREPGGRVTRINVERSFSKWFPSKIATLRLGLRFGKLVHVQTIYSVESTRKTPLTALVRELSLMYGEPRRWGETYFWWDRRTVLAASNAAVKTATGTELRTSLELMEKGYFEPFRQ